ncbi:MAG: hypothetical protein AAB322_09085, partial [Pseudomonadota bacterium]
FTRLDAAVAALRRVQANVKRWSISAMNAALDGRLIGIGQECSRIWPIVSIGDLLREPPCNGVSIKGANEPPGVPTLRLNAMSDHGFDYGIVRYLPLGPELARDLEIIEGDFFVSRGKCASINKIYISPRAG